jgi:hypothetical protein
MRRTCRRIDFANRRIPMPLVVIDGPTILAGQSLSDGVDCSAGTIVRITVPQEYNDGDMPNEMSFQVSSDGNGYNDLFDDEGKEITIVARANQGIVIDRAWARTVAFIKLRSGTRDRPTKQTEDCKLAIAISTP